jgi:hypothetical protein
MMALLFFVMAGAFFAVWFRKRKLALWLFALDFLGMIALFVHHTSGGLGLNL